MIQEQFFPIFQLFVPEVKHFVRPLERISKCICNY